MKHVSLKDLRLLNQDACAAEGIAFLAEHAPAGWLERIMTEADFSIGTNATCAVALATGKGDFADGCAALGLDPDGREVVQLGFHTMLEIVGDDPNSDENAPWRQQVELLDDAWHRAIAAYARDREGYLSALAA